MPKASAASASKTARKPRQGDADRAVAEPAFAYPKSPDAKIRWVWTLRGMGFAFLYSLFLAFPLGGAVTSIAAQADSGRGILYGVLIGFGALLTVAFLVALVYALLAQPRYSFEVGPEEVIVRRGVVFRTTSRIPLRKVQDIHVKQGPLLRAFGLASIKLETAGGSPMRWGMMSAQSEGQLPGLRNAEEVAERLMARVKQLRSDL